MHLEGQGEVVVPRGHGRHRRLDEDGFTMVVLLVVIAVMAVGLAAMLPTWRQQALREKEEELIFRGNQYARALVLYSRKNNNLLPANVEVLYDGKYLRKKWKDPVTGTDFALLPAGQPANATRGISQGARGTGPGAATGQQIIGSIQGVYSTSTATSVRIYQNQQRHIDWQFTAQTALPLMGGVRGGGPGGMAAPGRGRTGGPGGPGEGATPRGGGPARGIGPNSPPPRGGGAGTTPAPGAARGRGGD